jgi:HAMP domain-containing protein
MLIEILLGVVFSATQLFFIAAATSARARARRAVDDMEDARDPELERNDGISNIISSLRQFP